MADTGGTKLDTLYWELQVRVGRQQAEAEARAAGQAVGTALDKGVSESSSGAKAASEWVASLSKDLEARREDIKREAVAGLITAKEAGAAGRAASAEYVKELRGGLDALRNKGTIGVQDLPALLGQGATALVPKLNAASEATEHFGGVGLESAQGLGRMRLALVTLIDKATQVSPVFGRLGEVLLDLGAGGLVATAVVGGIAAIVVAYEKLTEGARKSEEAIKKVIDGLQKQVEAQFAASRAGKQAVASAAIFDEQNAYTRLQTARAGTSEVDFEGRPTGKIIVDLEAVKKAKEDYTDANKRFALANDNATQSEESRAAALGKALSAGKAGNAITSEATDLTKRYRAELTTLLASGNTSEETLARIGKLKDMVNELTAADKKSEKASESAEAKAKRLAQERARAVQGFDTAIAAQTPDKNDNIEEQIKRLTAAAVAAGVGTVEIQKKVTELRNVAAKANAEKIGNELAKIAAESTVTQVDNMNLALKETDKSLHNLGASDADIDHVNRLKQQMIDATAAAEKLAPLIEKIKRDTAEGVSLQPDLRDIETQIDALIAKRNQAQGIAILAHRAGDPQTTAEALDQKTLDELLAEEAAIRAKIKTLHDAAVKQTHTLAGETAKVSGEIANAANAAFGLASAFLGVNSEITKALGSIGQLASGISNVSTLANAAGGYKNLFSSASGIASALPGLGQAIGGAIALGSVLFGQSPEAKAREQRQKENTDAIIALTQRVGDLGKINVTGSDVLKTQDAVSRIIANPDAHNVFKGQAPFDKAIAAAGLTATQFAEIAKQFGITIDASKITLGDVIALQQAMKAAEFTQFADSFAGQMQELDAAVKLFPDLSDPIKQFDAFRKALDRIKDGGGILAKTLDSFDTSTAAGVAAAQAALQALFKQLQDGTLTAADLGGLTPQEFLDAIEKAMALLRSNPNGVAAGTGGFNVSQQITEVTGARMGALLSTANIFAGQTADNTALIARILGGVPNVGPIGAPPTLTPANGSGGNGPITFTLNISVSGVGGDTQAIGQKIGDATIRAIDSGLGSRAKWAQRAVGNVVRT